MHFSLVDRVLERDDSRIVTIKLVSSAEEYLQDHFATFPVLPGVFMLEAFVQAARLFADGSRPASAPPLVLGTVRTLKYGRFVKPGDTLRVECTLTAPPADDRWDFKASAAALSPGAPDSPTAASGRFILRPVRTPNL